ncbi:hypothetical protein [Catenulispora acidiphila]|nr:hypothetical protein [Catenulispora acidiphila]
MTDTVAATGAASDPGRTLVFPSVNPQKNTTPPDRDPVERRSA